MSKPTIIRVEESLSNHDYHSYGLEYISSSFLKNVAKRDVAFALSEHGKLDPTSRALIVGDAFHELVRVDGEKLLEERFYFIDDSEWIDEITKAWEKRNGKKSKNIYKTGDYEKKIESLKDPNKTLLTKAEWDTIHAMKAKMDEHSVLQALEPYIYREECSYFVEWNGLNLRVRPDREYHVLHDLNLHQEINGQDVTWNIPKGKYILDWKSIADLSKVESQSYSLKYPVQGVFYTQLLDYDGFFFLFSEKEGSNDCEFRILDPHKTNYDGVSPMDEMFDALKQIKHWKKEGVTHNINKPLIQTI